MLGLHIGECAFCPTLGLEQVLTLAGIRTHPRTLRHRWLCGTTHLYSTVWVHLEPRSPRPLPPPTGGASWGDVCLHGLRGGDTGPANGSDGTRQRPSSPAVHRAAPRRRAFIHPIGSFEALEMDLSFHWGQK